MEGSVPPGPICHSGGKPPQSMRWGDFEGTSEVAQRLDCASLLALSKSETVLGDLPPQPYLPSPFQGRPIRCLPDDIDAQTASSHPSPELGVPTQATCP